MTWEEKWAVDDLKERVARLERAVDHLLTFVPVVHRTIPDAEAASVEPRVVMIGKDVPDGDSSWTSNPTAPDTTLVFPDVVDVPKQPRKVKNLARS